MSLAETYPMPVTASLPEAAWINQPTQQLKTIRKRLRDNTNFNKKVSYFH